MHFQPGARGVAGGALQLREELLIVSIFLIDLILRVLAGGVRHLHVCGVRNVRLMHDLILRFKALAVDLVVDLR
jgi:hypothetical protein